MTKIATGFNSELICFGWQLYNKVLTTLSEGCQHHQISVSNKRNEKRKKNYSMSPPDSNSGAGSFGCGSVEQHTCRLRYKVTIYRVKF